MYQLLEFHNFILVTFDFFFHFQQLRQFDWFVLSLEVGLQFINFFILFLHFVLQHRHNTTFRGTTHSLWIHIKLIAINLLNEKDLLLQLGYESLMFHILVFDFINLLFQFMILEVKTLLVMEEFLGRDLFLWLFLMEEQLLWGIDGMIRFQ